MTVAEYPPSPSAPPREEEWSLIENSEGEQRVTIISDASLQDITRRANVLQAEIVSDLNDSYYDPSEYEVLPNMTVIVTGATNSGKSTFLNTLLFTDPSKGGFVQEELFPTNVKAETSSATLVHFQAGPGCWLNVGGNPQRFDNYDDFSDKFYNSILRPQAAPPSPTSSTSVHNRVAAPVPKEAEANIDPTNEGVPLQWHGGKLVSVMDSPGISEHTDCCELVEKNIEKCQAACCLIHLIPAGSFSVEQPLDIHTKQFLDKITTSGIPEQHQLIVVSKYDVLVEGQKTRIHRRANNKLSHEEKKAMAEKDYQQFVRKIHDTYPNIRVCRFCCPKEGQVDVHEDATLYLEEFRRVILPELYHTVCTYDLQQQIEKSATSAAACLADQGVQSPENIPEITNEVLDIFHKKFKERFNIEKIVKEADMRLSNDNGYLARACSKEAYMNKLTVVAYDDIKTGMSTSIRSTIEDITSTLLRKHVPPEWTDVTYSPDDKDTTTRSLYVALGSGALAIAGQAWSAENPVVVNIVRCGALAITVNIFSTIKTLVWYKEDVINSMVKHIDNQVEAALPKLKRNFGDYLTRELKTLVNIQNAKHDNRIAQIKQKIELMEATMRM